MTRGVNTIGLAVKTMRGSHQPAHDARAVKPVNCHSRPHPRTYSPALSRHATHLKSYQIRRRPNADRPPEGSTTSTKYSVRRPDDLHLAPKVPTPPPRHTTSSRRRPQTQARLRGSRFAVRTPVNPLRPGFRRVRVPHGPCPRRSRWTVDTPGGCWQLVRAQNLLPPRERSAGSASRRLQPCPFRWVRRPSSLRLCSDRSALVGLASGWPRSSTLIVAP